jgi:hypothetical protein
VGAGRSMRATGSRGVERLPRMSSGRSRRTLSGLSRRTLSGLSRMMVLALLMRLLRYGGECQPQGGRERNRNGQLQSFAHYA